MNMIFNDFEYQPSFEVQLSQRVTTNGLSLYPMSFLPVLDLCDNFRPKEHDLIPFCITDDRRSVIGLLWSKIITELKEDNEHNTKSGKLASWAIALNSGSPGKPSLVNFASHLNSPTLRSAAIQELTKRWHTEGKFADVIGGRLWRNELYPIYRNPFGPRDADNFAFEVERVACALFGLVTYGVHMTIYRLPSSGTDEEIRIWVPTRARTKQTCV